MECGDNGVDRMGFENEEKEINGRWQGNGEVAWVALVAVDAFASASVLLDSIFFFAKFSALSEGVLIWVPRIVRCLLYLV